MTTNSKRAVPAVKICGITNLEDARYVSGALVDFIGFIFHEKSPRYIEPAKAGAIINWLQGPNTVGVFVNHPLDEVNRIAKETGLNFVQLHGQESPEYCSFIDLPVIKALPVAENTKVESLQKQVEEYADFVDYFLFDTKSKDQFGGTGKTFDWAVLSEIKIPKPFFVSGGLDAANVQQAILSTGAFGVDASGKLEEKPGIKDFDKVEAFLDVVQNLNIHQQ